MADNKCQDYPKAGGTSTDNNTELVLESLIDKPLSIPGLISCSGDEDYPDGKTCLQDL